MSATSPKTPYTVDRLGQSCQGDQFLEVRVRMPKGWSVSLVSVKELQESPDKAMNRISGLISGSTRTRFRQVAEQAVLEMASTFEVSTRTGFVKHSFILPSKKVIGPRVATHLPEEILRYGSRFGEQGTLKDWKEISALAVGNSRLMLALALAFTGPIIDLLKLPAPMINLFGPAATGKTTIGRIAGSILGGGEDGLFPDSWNNTVNNLEIVAAAHHATLLVLDETKIAGGVQSILDAIMRLEQGYAKGRLTDAKPARLSRVPLLSTSNYSICELARDAGAAYDAAHSSRMLDVPLPAGKGGAFENLHGMRHAAAFCERLMGVASENHGVAFSYFLRHLTADLIDDQAAWKAWLRTRREYFLSLVGPKVITNIGGIRRVHGHFATIYAAGCLAIEYNLLPGTRRGLADALVQCELDHVAHVSPFLCAVHKSETIRPSSQPLDPLLRLNAHVGTAKLVDLRPGLPSKGEHDHDTCPGYINNGAAGVECLFSNKVFVRICGGQREAEELKTRLQKTGLLLRDGNRPSTRRHVWKSRGQGQRVHVIAVRAEAFDGLTL